MSGSKRDIIIWVAFVTGLETFQILGTESNVQSFEAFFTIYLSIIT
jgi:hypothetical protein